MAAVNKPQPTASVPVTEAQVLHALRTGKMKEKGLLPYSSNHNFLVVITDGELELPAVYKPQRGENPLWDFDYGTLCLRETAAYVISQALDWQLVPPTVLRDGKHGLGSVQFYVDHDPNNHYFTIQDDARFANSLRQLALFDFVTNNADRKSGHCLVGTDERLWGIDHGICFHAEFKLRTVIWEFSGQPIEPALLDALAALSEQLCTAESNVSNALERLLNEQERAALHQRLRTLLRQQLYPSPHPQRRNYPWPPV
jgi:uncharacterized repeat protein (TIGR03843 family)